MAGRERARGKGKEEAMLRVKNRERLLCMGDGGGATVCARGEVTGERWCYMHKDRWSVCSSSDEKRRNEWRSRVAADHTPHLQDEETCIEEGENETKSAPLYNDTLATLRMASRVPELHHRPEFRNPFQVLESSLVPESFQVPESSCLCNPLLPGGPQNSAIPSVPELPPGSGLSGGSGMLVVPECAGPF